MARKENDDQILEAEKGSKVVNLTYFDPTQPSIFGKPSRTDRERVTLYLCSNCDSCDAYKHKKCAMLCGLASTHGCPYGKERTFQGYTKGAKKCGELVRKYKEKYKDETYALRSLDHLCRIGDYVYLGLSYLKNYVNPFRPDIDLFGGDMIKVIDFTPELVKELIEFRPRALFDRSEIKDYQEKLLPMFCLQMRKYLPDMYEKVKAVTPEIERLADSVDLRGKEAKVLTLLPGKVKLGTMLFDWDGERITGTGKQLSFFGLGDEQVAIIPTCATFVTVVDNETVTDTTEFR